VIATTAHGSVDDSTMRKLNTHMAHSAATSAMYYQLQSQNDAVDVHTTIQEIKQRQYFTTEEDSCILQEYLTQNDQTPMLEMCQLVVSKYNLKRTPKNIQDRWRQLKKQSS